MIMRLAVTVSSWARARQSEIQNLDAGFPDHDVAGLEIAVNDALAVRLYQRSHNLRSVERALSSLEEVRF